MLPKRRTSRTVKRARRSHLALRPIGLSACPQCSTAKVPHRACSNCGYVNSKVSIKIKTEEK